MIATLLTLSGTPTKEEFEDLILRALLVGEHDDDFEAYDGIGVKLIEFYTEVFFDEDEDTILEAEDAEKLFLEIWGRTYARRMNAYAKQKGYDRRQDPNDLEPFCHYETFCPHQRMPKEFVSKLAGAMADMDASRTIRINDYCAKLRA